MIILLKIKKIITKAMVLEAGFVATPLFNSNHPCQRRVAHDHSDQRGWSHPNHVYLFKK
jgi:hypothetical protein